MATWTRRKKRKQPERLEQIKFVTWLRKEGFRCHHSPNGGSRNLLEAVKLKAMGVSPGFPDVEVPWPTKTYHGFYCEMKKAKGGTLSEVQQEWLNYLNEQGYHAICANGFEEAREKFLAYINT